jgi:hypothetical protein
MTMNTLQSAIDDGQEVKLYKLSGHAGYCVEIYGDCHCESRDKETLDAAITEAVAKYAQWLKSL